MYYDVTNEVIHNNNTNLTWLYFHSPSWIVSSPVSLLQEKRDYSCLFLVSHGPCSSSLRSRYASSCCASLHVLKILIFSFSLGGLCSCNIMCYTDNIVQYRQIYRHKKLSKEFWCFWVPLWLTNFSTCLFYHFLPPFLFVEYL